MSQTDAMYDTGEAAYQRYTERTGNMNVELAAMTQDCYALRLELARVRKELDSQRRENEQLRREVRELARMASIECYLDECCPKQKALRPSNPNVCVDCTIEDARESIQAAQVGKEGE